MIGPEFEGAVQVGGALADLNGNVFGMPSDADCVLRVDGETDEVTVIGKGALGPDIKNKWQGAVLAPDGALYVVPGDAVGARIDPETNECSLVGDPLGRAGQVAGRLPRRERRHLLHPGKRRPRPADRPARAGGTEEARAEGKKKKKKNTRDAAGLSAVLAAAAASGAAAVGPTEAAAAAATPDSGASLSLGVAAAAAAALALGTALGRGRRKRKPAETRGAGKRAGREVLCLRRAGSGERSYKREPNVHAREPVSWYRPRLKTSTRRQRHQSPSSSRTSAPPPLSSAARAPPWHLWARARASRPPHDSRRARWACA